MQKYVCLTAKIFTALVSNEIGLDVTQPEYTLGVKSMATITRNISPGHGSFEEQEFLGTGATSRHSREEMELKPSLGW